MAHRLPSSAPPTVQRMTLTPLLMQAFASAPAPARTVPDRASGEPDWAAWADYFEENTAMQDALECAIDWGEPVTMPTHRQRAWAASLQRFQVGESGDGAHLLGELARGWEDDVLPATRAFVAEERGHARLLRVLLARFGAVPIERHWSDAAFVVARRSMGVATELSVIAVAEGVALVYYGRLAEGAPDPVIRGVARRILADELGHVPFVESRIAVDLARWGRGRQWALRALWWAAGVGGTAVLALDHSAVLRECGTTRRAAVRAAWASVRDVRHATYARAASLRSHRKLQMAASGVAAEGRTASAASPVPRATGTVTGDGAVRRSPVPHR